MLKDEDKRKFDNTRKFRTQFQVWPIRVAIVKLASITVGIELEPGSNQKD